LRETGAPLQISGIAVEIVHHRLPPWSKEKQRYTRLQVGVWPPVSEKLSAYRADVLGAAGLNPVPRGRCSRTTLSKPSGSRRASAAYIGL
jgi:hypothetical protein